MSTAPLTTVVYRRASAHAPADYSEVFTQYMAYIRHLVARSGIPLDDRDDVSVELLIKFIEKDVLSQYDPDKVHTTVKADGSVFASTASFKTLLRSFMLLYVRHQRDRIQVRRYREILCSPHQASQDVEPGEYARSQLELLAEPDHAEEIIERAEQSHTLRSHRYLLSSISWRDRHLCDVFDAMVAVYERDDRITRELVGAQLGVTKTAAGLGIKAVREALADQR